MKIDDLEKIEQELKDGLITSDEAAKLVYTTGKKPWSTKEWEQLRERLIKNFCEQCKTSEGPFVLQHMWHPGKYQSQVDEYITTLYNKEVEIKPINTVSQEELQQFIDENGENRDSCPKCGSVNIKFKSIQETSYICNRCKHNFIEPVAKIYVKGCITEDDIKSRILIRKYNGLQFKIWNEHTEEIRKYAVLKGIEEHKRYISCIDTVTFCNKCSFMWDKNRMKLCNVCGKGYHGFAYKTCIKCKSL